MVRKNYRAITRLRRWYEWHHEDAWAVSRQLPIYAVADGITQPLYLNLNQPLGPKEVAGIFCRRAICYLENHYSHLSAKVLAEAYAEANDFIRAFNRRRSAHYATVAAVAVVKDGRLFGSRLTDCGFAVVRRGKLFFKTPEFWSKKAAAGRDGYGRLDGEGDPRPFVDYWQLPVATGDTLALFSDGFECHFSEGDFVASLSAPLVRLVPELTKVDRALNRRNAKKYGDERTLLAVRL